MRIAILGIRGVPARYGGLETCAEEVGVRLVERGHEVTCYCRKGGPDDDLAEYKGIKRINLPSMQGKATDTYSHSFFACCHVLTQKPDVILAFNPAISTLCIIPKIFGHRVALNPNGFDWRRPKWGSFARRFIYASAYIASKVCDQLIIDAKSVCDYYAEDFACDPIHIPNGTNIDSSPADLSILKEYGLEKDRYFLFLSRLVPDNSCEHVIEAFEGLDTEMKLFMGGPAEEGSAYPEKLYKTTDSRILFPGAIYDPEHVKALHQGAYALIHGNQPGGTSLGLLKALGYATCVLTLDTTDNAYVVQDSALTYQLSAEDLRGKLKYLLDNPNRVDELREMAIARCEEGYAWEHITDQYEAALKKIARQD